jgi:hypothetical protein
MAAIWFIINIYYGGKIDELEKQIKKLKESKE